MGPAAIRGNLGGPCESATERTSASFSQIGTDMTDIVKRLRQDFTTEPIPLHAEAADEIERLRRCIASIEDELTRDPPRVGDALFVCEAARAI